MRSSGVPRVSFSRRASSLAVGTAPEKRNSTPAAASIDSLDDEHIVATAFDAVYTDVGTSARALAGQDAGKVACTVVAALLMSALQLLRFVLIFLGRSGRDQRGGRR